MQSIKSFRKQLAPSFRMSLAALALGSLVAGLVTPRPVTAQIQRHPTGVNVNAQGATSVFITFGNLDGMVSVEAEWCGELVDAAPAVGQRCDPATSFGRLPLRYDRSRFSGAGGLTDVMSIPPSVSRRAYQAAEDGRTSSFFYVRRFTDPAGIRPDEYVTVTCRLTGGGARTPFALLDVRLAFATDDPVLPVPAGTVPPPLRAEIAYNGTGRLKGRWEIVYPGEDQPEQVDLLTEATLPVEQRGTQRRYTELDRFNVFLPPTGAFVLEGPDPASLPTEIEGLYLVVLRIEASDDKEADSDLAAAGAGTGTVHSGGVAGFSVPPLRYYVGSAGPIGAAGGRGLAASEPADGARLVAGAAADFAWEEHPGAIVHRIEIRDSSGTEVLAALLRRGNPVYRSPSWLWDALPDGELSWRVVALGLGGRELEATRWRYAAAASDPSPDSTAP